MVTLTIDGRTVQAQEGATILEAAAQADIHIPHLCYLKGINEIAACRVCCVEVEGERAMVTACNNPVKEGMVVPAASMWSSSCPSTTASVPPACAAATAGCRPSPTIWAS